MSVTRRILRPFYRTFIEAPLWHFLAKVKLFFFADTNDRLEKLQRENAERLVREEIEGIQSCNLQRLYFNRQQNQSADGVPGNALTQKRLASIEERLRIAETNNTAQWDALEQLILALFRQPEAYNLAFDNTESTQDSSMPSDAASNRAHAASNIR